MVIELKADYTLTELELYSMSQMVINSGKDPVNIIKMSNYKDKYTIPFFTTRQNNLNAAKLQETATEIIIDHVIKRDELVTLSGPCCANFLKLKGYIKDAYPKSQHDAMNIAAGAHYYATAMNQNWESVSALNTAMIHFTTNPEKLTALLLNNNMKAAFPATILSNSNAFELGHNAFITARQTGTKTNNKITANNLVYSDMVDICADAQIALMDFPDLQKLFVMATLKDIISPPGSASYKLDAKLAVEFTQISGLLVKIQAEGQPAITLTTDATGIVNFENINPAKYTVTISGPGLTSQTFKKDVNSGTNAHSEVIVHPLPPPPPPLEPPV
ncbi:MAG: carboxypeptidase-like regulatory domain-containing protein [Bacteroidota bacterium]